MYTASVNDADSDQRSEDNMKYESVVENDMKWYESIAEKQVRAAVCAIQRKL